MAKTRIFKQAGEYCFRATDGMVSCDYRDEDEAQNALDDYEQDGTQPRGSSVMVNPKPELTAKYSWAASQAKKTSDARAAEAQALTALTPGTQVRVSAERWNPAVYKDNGKMGVVTIRDRNGVMVRLSDGAEKYFGPSDLVIVNSHIPDSAASRTRPQ
jgi:hypothetical protein